MLCLIWQFFSGPKYSSFGGWSARKDNIIPDYYLLSKQASAKGMLHSSSIGQCMQIRELQWKLLNLKIKKNYKKINFRYLPQAVFVALMIVGPSKFLKQII